MSDERLYRLGESDDEYGGDWKQLLTPTPLQYRDDIGIRFHPSAIVVSSVRPDPSFGIGFPQDD